MPSSSKEQAKAMRAAANNPRVAKSMGITQQAAKEWVQADKAAATRKKKRRK